MLVEIAYGDTCTDSFVALVVGIRCLPGVAGCLATVRFAGLGVAAVDAGAVREIVSETYVLESRRVFATLIRLLGDFDLAEEAMQEAFSAAVIQWERDGIPENRRSWLISAGRFKAIDLLRKRTRADATLADLARSLESSRMAASGDNHFADDDTIQDDRLRLIFTCCHPALSLESQIALTLREVCGLSTEQIANAFLTTPSTLAQRIVRAKSKIRDAKIPYEVPSEEEMKDRLDAVLHVIYLVFNEGYAASSGDRVTRVELSSEAIRLGRILADLLPEPEVIGLLALMLLHESRRQARTDDEGEIILLDMQDRSKWNEELMREGLSLIQQSLSGGSLNVYSIQAAISAVHAEAADSMSTDWGQIVALYDILLRLYPTPVVELNRAVAVAMHQGAEQGVILINALLDRGDLSDYHLAHSARGELYRRLGDYEKAGQSFQRALELASQEPERKLLIKRLHALEEADR